MTEEERKEIEGKVYGILSEVIIPDSHVITDDRKLAADLGCDSLDILDITMRIERAFRFTVNHKTAGRMGDMTVRELVDMVCENIGVKQQAT